MESVSHSSTADRRPDVPAPCSMRSASLVCKKWHALCLRCPDLEVSLTSHGDPLLAKLRSLAAWLVVAGGHHLRCLAVDLHM